MAQKWVHIAVKKSDAPDEMKSATVTLQAKSGQTATVDYTLPEEAGYGAAVNENTEFFTVDTTNGLVLTAAKDCTQTDWPTDQSKTFTVPVTGAADYNDYTLTVTVTPSYKQKAEPVTVTARNRTYDGTKQALITVEGTAVNGTMKYKLGTDGTYGTDIPEATDVGSYTVYYKAEKASDEYVDSDEGSVIVTIAEVDKGALTTAIENAETLYNSMIGNDDYDEIATALKKSIDAAKALKDKKNVTAADVSVGVTSINTAKTTAETEKTNVDTANDTSDQIVRLLSGLETITTADKPVIDEAKAAYANLTDAQKEKFPAKTLAALEAAVSDLDTALAAEELAENKATFETEKTTQAAEADKLAAAGDSEASKNLIADAKAAIEALTYDEAKTPEENKAAVDAIIAKLQSDLQATRAAEKKDAEDTAAANEASKQLTALPESGKVTTADKAAIEAARKAYEVLTADQKAKVDAAALKKLTDAEAALKTAEAALKAAEEAEIAKKEAEDKAAADETSKVISALPKSSKVTTADKEAIEAARKAYEALTDDQKAKVDAATLKKLTNAEAALKAAEKAGAELATAKEESKRALNEEITVTQIGKSIQIKWTKAPSADGYEVYVQYCGKKFAKPVKTITKSSTTKLSVSKINGRKLNLKKNFKVKVSAYKTVNGTKEILATSQEAHVVGVKNTKYTNVKSVKLTKSKYTVTVGKTDQIKAKVVLVDKSKKHIPSSHGAKFRYRSSDESIATVDKNGKLKGIRKGTCTVYVYSINGKVQKAAITVK